MRRTPLGFNAIVISSFLLFQHGATAFDGTDGMSPYGDGFAPDVVSLDPGWNSSYPEFEGDVAAELEDDVPGGNFTREAAITEISRRDAKDFYLRVLPLGASITQGVASTDGNGYRKLLRDQLRWKGWKVNMVGSKQDGTMADNDNEGHPGWVITEIHNAFRQVQWMQPNLVLINAGTNDCNTGLDTENAGTRLKTMIDDIFTSVPGVSIVVSTLVPSRDHASCATRVSQLYRNLVSQYPSGTRIVLADINNAMPTNLLSSDGTHPNDSGYKLFAAVWWDAIRKLENLIQPPASNAGIDDSAVGSWKTCKKVAGNARGPVQSQRGSGQDDGNYVHDSVAHGAIKSARIEKNSDPEEITDAIPWHMFFANLVANDPNFERKDALDDWIRIFHDTKTGKNTYWFRQNKGGGEFGPSVTFDVGQNCDSGPRYAFADFNNDGLDDFFCLKEGSAMTVSLNRGGNPPRFETIGQVVGTHDGFASTDVRIGDIDGDGRADYCLVNSDGTLICSRNGGVGDSPQWQGFSTPSGVRGTVFDKRKSDKSGVVLGDMNGDFRSDFLYIGDKGSVETWINSRGWGKGIVPDWRSAGVTHSGQTDSGIQGNIKFGRIFGSGRLDYIYLKEDKTGYDVIVWENKGSGGTKRKADGNFYCDMRGSGADDYVWIYQDGHANEINVNIHNPPNWGHSLTMSLSVPGPRVGIHLADWDGDGRCDVLVQNKATGALTLYANQYNSASNTLTFVNRGVVTGAATCTEGWGVGIFDRGMRLADIDGDKRADVLCLEENGRVTGWLNTASGMQNVGQVKFSEGWDRANMRLADVEGSGRADLIWLDKYTGAATVFKNNGRGTTSGSSFSWTNRGVLYSPIDRGETMHFTNQGGLGRADLLHVLPWTNRAWTYFNECGGGRGGDDGTVGDPQLPDYETGGGLPGDGAEPPNNGDGESGGGEVPSNPLYSDSSCNDIKGVRLNKDLWSPLMVTRQFAEWHGQWLREDHSGGWMGDFLRPLGIEQSTTSCTLEKPCSRPNCDDLEDDSLPQTGWKYEVAVAAVNLNQYLSAVWAATNNAYARFGALEVTMGSLFYPKEPDHYRETSITLAILSAVLGTVFGVAGAFHPAGGAVGSAVTGAIGIASASLDPPQDVLLHHIGEIEMLALDWINKTQDVIRRMNSDLIQGKGIFPSPSGTTELWQLLEGGQFVDYQALPILSDQVNKMDATNLGDDLFQLLSVGVVNWAWQQQNVYIACFPMSADDYERNKNAGFGSDLSMFVEGLGCFYQSQTKTDLRGDGFNQAPPGWNSLDSDLFKFSALDAMNSSVKTFLRQGFGGDVPLGPDFIENFGPTLLVPNAYQAEGMWNIPVCLPWATDDANRFYSPSEDEPAYVGFNFFIKSLGGTNQASRTWCFCSDTPDPVTGQRFKDIYRDVNDFFDTTCYWLGGLCLLPTSGQEPVLEPFCKSAPGGGVMV